MRGRLLLERPSGGWVDRYRSYEVFVNGELRAELARGAEISIEVDPGDIEIYLKIDWCQSRAVQLNVADGAEARIYCRPRTIFTGLFAVVFRRNDYMQLEVA